MHEGKVTDADHRNCPQILSQICHTIPRLRLRW